MDRWRYRLNLLIRKDINKDSSEGFRELSILLIANYSQGSKEV